MSQQQKDYNKEVAAERVPVEHCIGRMKQVRMIQQMIRIHKVSLATYCTDQKIDSQFVIDAIDEFIATQPDKRGRPAVTLLVLDNASIHQAKIFQAACQRGEQQGLLVWYLPTYSPHLNRIERLWLRMKYSCGSPPGLKPADYANLKARKDGLQRIFDQFDDSYTIKFKTPKVSINST